MMQPHYTAEHIEEHRAEFEDRWRLEAIERGITANREFIEIEREHILLTLEHLQKLDVPEAKNMIEGLQYLLKSLEQYQGNLDRIVASFNQARDERQQWRQDVEKFMQRIDTSSSGDEK